MSLLTVKVDLLRDGQLRISCARREVHDKHVQCAPVDIVQQLLDSFHNHQASPDHRSLFTDEIAHRHGLDAIVSERNELVLCRGGEML